MMEGIRSTNQEKLALKLENTETFKETETIKKISKR